MTKCDFCKDSKPNPQTGQMECPYRHCWMPQDEINKILKMIMGGKKR